MQSSALDGGFTDPAVDSALAFRAVLEAMSRPGSVRTADLASPPQPMGRAAGTVALTLCDHDTPVWLAPDLDRPDIREWLAFHTGAVPASRGEAAFAFGTWQDMAPISDFAIGVSEFPDRSATLVIEVPELGEAHRLTGPGIQSTARLTVPDMRIFQSNHACFPLGWDALLTCGDRLAGLPRSTKVES